MSQLGCCFITAAEPWNRPTREEAEEGTLGKLVFRTWAGKEESLESQGDS